MPCRMLTSHKTVADAFLPAVDIIAIPRLVCKGGKFLYYSHWHICVIHRTSFH